MPEEIDFKALYDSAIAENELLRLTVLKLRYAHSPLDNLRKVDVRKFVQENYLLIVLLLMTIPIAMSLLKTVKGLFPHTKDQSS